MRHIIPFIPILLCSPGSLAQTPSCDALPISYDPLGITFGAGESSFGDSVITIPVTNTSATNMAYPQLKLVPITPLPPGMTQNTHWYTFASSWNVGLTMPASCFFDVITPIPPDYTVTFEGWAYNLDPLLVGDSCVFAVPFTINLNPSNTGVPQSGGRGAFSIWPVPAADLLRVTLPGDLSRARLSIMTMTGTELRTKLLEASSLGTVVDLGGLAPGAYVLGLVADDGTALHQRFVIAR